MSDRNTVPTSRQFLDMTPSYMVMKHFITKPVGWSELILSKQSLDKNRPDLKMIQRQIKKYKIKYFWLQRNSDITKA